MTEYDVVADIKQLLSGYSDKHVELQSLREQLQSAQQENSRLRKQLDNSNHTIRQLNDMVKTHHQKLAAEFDASKMHQEAVKQLTDYLEENASLKQELALARRDHVKQCALLQTSQAQLTAELSSLQEQLESTVAEFLEQAQSSKRQHQSEMSNTKAAYEQQLHQTRTALQQAVSTRDELSAKLDAERQAFQTTLQSFNANKNEILWKNKLLKMRAEGEQARRERDHYMRVLESHGIMVQQ